MSGLRGWRIPYSTNVERVTLALAHKRLTADWIDVTVADRSAVVEISGQDLVPVLQTPSGEVLSDSMTIVAWLDAEVPAPALWPADAGARANTDVFVQWFNHVWKVAPNAIAAEQATPQPDAGRIAACSARLAGWLPWFDALLCGRDFLLGDELGAADICAFPFLKYGLLPVAADDPDPFHPVLVEHLKLGGRFPRLAAWIERVDGLPRS